MKMSFSQLFDFVGDMNTLVRISNEDIIFYRRYYNEQLIENNFHN